MGSETSTPRDITFLVGQAVGMGAVLKVHITVQQVTVRGTVAQRNPLNTSYGDVIENREIQSLTAWGRGVSGTGTPSMQSRLQSLGQADWRQGNCLASVLSMR